MSVSVSPLAAPGTAALFEANNALDGVRTRAPAAAATDSKDKLRDKAQDFEAVFINSMFQQMYTGIEGEGPFGGSPGVGVWRSFLTDQYAKSFAKAGGIGLADHVYRELLTLQAGKSAAKTDGANATVEPIRNPSTTGAVP